MNILEVMNSGKTLRYHTVDSTRQQTVGDHSWGVAVLVLYICDDPSPELMKKALFHDCAETYTGDVPAHVKWANPSLKDILDAIEEKTEVAMGIDVQLNDDEYRILKMADMLELLFYVVSQLRLGNENYRIIFHRGMKFMHDHNEWWNDKIRELTTMLLKEVSSDV